MTLPSIQDILITGCQTEGQTSDFIATPADSSEPIPTSVYAKRYGVAPAEIPSIADLRKDGRSALTPLPLVNLSELPDAQKKRRYDHEMWQESRLRGFTSHVLLASGCLEKPDIPNCSLKNTLHPLFTKDKWLSETDSERVEQLKPLHNGLAGSYSAWNDKTPVWDALQPSLKLASRMIESSNMWLWFDALIHGDRFDVPDDQWLQSQPKRWASVAGNIPRQALDGGPGQDKCQLKYFHTRNPQTAAGAVDSQRKVIEELAQPLLLKPGEHVRRITFDFAHDPTYKGLTQQRWVQKGGTNKLEPRWAITVAGGMILPLLLDTISPSERLVNQFHLAKTLVHEICHALTRYAMFKFRSMTPRNIGFEDFFRDEEMAESGKSCENAIYGGVMISAMELYSKPCIGMMVETPFPNFIQFADGKKPQKTGARFRCHDRFKINKYDVLGYYWPVQIGWMESLMKEDCWKCIYPALHADYLKPPRIVGRCFKKIMKSKDKLEKEKVAVKKKGSTNDMIDWGMMKWPTVNHVFGPDYRHWIINEGPPARSIPPEPPLDATDLQRWIRDAEIRGREAAIRTAIMRKKLGYTVRMPPAPDVEQSATHAANWALIAHQTQSD